MFYSGHLLEPGWVTCEATITELYTVGTLERRLKSPCAFSYLKWVLTGGGGEENL